MQVMAALCHHILVWPKQQEDKQRKSGEVGANRDRVAKGLSVRRGQDRIPLRLVLLLCFVCVVVCLFVFGFYPLLLSGGVFVTTTGLYTGPLPVHS